MTAKMSQTELILDLSRKVLKYDASTISNKYSDVYEIIRVGCIINEVVRNNITSCYMGTFVNKAIKFDMRDSELVQLYIQLAVYGFKSSNNAYYMSSIVGAIRKKVTNFNNWTIITIFDSEVSIEDRILMELGVYPIYIDIGADGMYEQYLCNAEYPGDNSVNNYIMKHVSKLRIDECYIMNALTQDLVLTGKTSQFDILPRRKIVQSDFACLQECVMYLKNRDPDMAQDVLKIKDNVMYWYHNGYKIQCESTNQFNMIEVNKALDEIVNA